MRVSTSRPRWNAQHFADGIFKRIFFNTYVWMSSKTSPKFVPKGPINNIPALDQMVSCAENATSHCLNQWWLVYWRIYASLGLNELSYFFIKLQDRFEVILRPENIQGPIVNIGFPDHHEDLESLFWVTMARLFHSPHNVPHSGPCKKPCFPRLWFFVKVTG